jgi:hypothetical protein
MTTYYLKSQLTEKLGTDANLAEQIELTPQTAKTYSGSNYYRQAASATGTGTDIAFVPPSSTRFDYLSVKNTGTNDLFIIFANKITDLSLTVSGSTVTDTTSAGSGSVQAGKTTFTNTNDAGITKLAWYKNFENAVVRVGTNSYQVVSAAASGSGDSIVLRSTQSFSGAFTADANLWSSVFIPAGTTLVTKADGYITPDGTGPYAFAIYSNTEDGASFQALEAVVTGVVQ